MAAEVLRGDAARILKTLSRPNQAPGVYANALRQAVALGCFGSTKHLYDLVSDNPNLTYDPGLDKIVLVGERGVRAQSLVALGHQAVGQILGKQQRFTYDKTITMRPIRAPKTDPAHVGRMLDERPRPVDRIALLVRSPGVTSAGLATLKASSKQPFSPSTLPFPSIAAALRGVTPAFNAIPLSKEGLSHYSLYSHGSLTVVQRSRPVGVYGRMVNLHNDNGPTLHLHGLQFVEHTYTAVQDEWADMLPGELLTVGNLAVKGSLDALDELLAMQDPQVAVPLAGAAWLHQKISPNIHGGLSFEQS